MISFDVHGILGVLTFNMVSFTRTKYKHGQDMFHIFKPSDTEIFPLSSHASSIKLQIAWILKELILYLMNNKD